MLTHVVCARADVVASKLAIIGANVVRARADVVATKLFLSSSFLPHTFLPEGVCLGS